MSLINGFLPLHIIEFTLSFPVFIAIFIPFISPPYYNSYKGVKFLLDFFGLPEDLTKS